MQLNRWDVARLALQLAAAAVALYYFLAYSTGCSFARGPLRGREQLGDVAGDASEGRGRGLVDAGELEQLDAGDVDAVVELEQQPDAGDVDAHALEQPDAGELGPDAAADAGDIDAGGAQCVLTCEAKGYPGGKLCTASELPGKVLCCCAVKP